MNLRLLNKVVLIFLLCAVFVHKAQGQEYPWSLQYLTNMNMLNPAFVAIWDQAGLLASTRTNWVGVHGAPLSQYVGYYTPVKDQKTGFGLNIHRLNTGLEKCLSITGDYAYQVRLDRFNYLRLGLRVGVLNYDNNLSNYQLYPDHIPDPEFSSDVRYYNMTTFGIGGVFYNDHLFVSFSVPQVINNTFKVNKDEMASSVANPKTAYLCGSHIFNVLNRVHFRPNLLMVATLGKPLYFDVACLVYLPSNLQFGINYRTNGNVCFLAQYTFKNNIRVGYAYDYALISEIRKYKAGTYEFLIGYDLNFHWRRSFMPHYF